MNEGSMLNRKLTVTYVTTLVVSMILASWYIAVGLKGEPPYQIGKAFLSWTFFYSLYVGAIVLFYGNLISVGIEGLQKKGLIPHTWLYVLLHGVFGLASGFLFQEPLLAIAGMIVALFYAWVDRWLYARANVQRSTDMFYLFPVIACGLLFGVFQLQSEPLPPFGMNEAVAFATDGEGTVTDHFPKQVGKWEGRIDGYQVERETAAKETGNETYLITFTERWTKGEEKGSWFLSYEVDRRSLTAKSGKGTSPPYTH